MVTTPFARIAPFARRVRAAARYGRYFYATGGNPEAARRAGINVARIRTIAFALCGFTAGIAALPHAALLGGTSSDVNGGQQVLASRPT